MIEVKCCLYDKVVLCVYVSDLESARTISDILIHAREYDFVEFDDPNPNIHKTYVYVRSCS